MAPAEILKIERGSWISFMEFRSNEDVHKPDISLNATRNGGGVAPSEVAVADVIGSSWPAAVAESGVWRRRQRCRTGRRREKSKRNVTNGEAGVDFG